MPAAPLEWPVSRHHPVLEAGDAGRLDGSDLLELRSGVAQAVEEALADRRATPGRRGAQARRAVLPPSVPLNGLGVRPRAARPGRSRRPSPAWSARRIPSVTKWYVVPPSISTGSRGRCVRMSTSSWYGGSSVGRPPSGPSIGFPPCCLDSPRERVISLRYRLRRLPRSDHGQLSDVPDQR